MSYKVQCRANGEILHFEIAGEIRSHIDSIAVCVRYRMVRSKIQTVLLDFRHATGRPSPMKLFLHVLKYPPMHHINCALVYREDNRDLLGLYAKLMHHRGNRSQLFASIEEAAGWLKTTQQPNLATDDNSARTLHKRFQVVLDTLIARKSLKTSHLRHSA